MRIYDSLKNDKVDFKPLDPKGKQIKMYVCGPTVYDEPHIGHARSAYIFDVIRRYFKYKGYKVTFVRNVTDIDDKIIKKAKEDFKDEDIKDAIKKVSKKYLNAYHKALKALGITTEPGDIIEPKATEYVGKMKKFIAELIKKDVAYGSDGDVYFDITKAKNYGKLSNQNIEKLKEGARIQPGEKKKNALDFALWKKSKEDEPAWPSSWGGGRPGWHIECSVMSSDILGNEFDIHGGGIDLIFPHHENEIAQSEGAGKKFAKIWMHHGLLTINGQKMAKSLGNFITVEGALENINAQDDAKADILKDFFLGAEYSNPIDFTNKSIKESTEAIYSILELLKKDQGIKKPKEDDETIKLNIEQFGKAMNDNFNMLRARACIFGIRRHCNDLLGREKTEDVKHAVQWGINTIRKLGKDVLGLSLPELNPRDPKWKDTSVINVYKDVENENKIIDDKVNERQRLRKEKKYAEADKIRKELEAKGVILEDKTDQPTEWRWKR